MAPLIFADTYNMVTFLSKSDVSAGFDQIIDFLNTHAIRKRMVVTEDVIRQDLRLDDSDGVECLPNEEIFAELARMGYEKPPPNTKQTACNEFSCSMASAVIYLATAIINTQVDDLSSHNTKYTSPALTQKVFSNMRTVGKGFLGVETPLFASMLVRPQPQDANEEEEEEDEIPTAPTPPSPTNAPSSIKAVEVSGSDSTQETPTNDPKEMTEEDVQNMLEIVPVTEFKIEALQVKYPIIDWEIHSKGSRSYWKIIRVGGIKEAYQSFEDVLKGIDSEDLVALWRLVKEKFSTAVPNVDKEKALWVELKRLFELDAEDVLWKL
nr:hypothetical protein [Tanacetum cinerariifolium]